MSAESVKQAAVFIQMMNQEKLASTAQAIIVLKKTGRWPENEEIKTLMELVEMSLVITMVQDEVMKRFVNNQESIKEIERLHAESAELSSLKRSISESQLAKFFPQKEMSFHDKVVFAIANKF